MTRDEFIAKWGTEGEHQRGRRWRTEPRGIEIDDRTGCGHRTLADSDGGKIWLAWDAFLTALGHKPKDPREEVFKRYGWVWDFEKECWHNKGFRVYGDGSGVESWDGNAHLITTKEQAEALCKFVATLP